MVVFHTVASCASHDFCAYECGAIIPWSHQLSMKSQHAPQKRTTKAPIRSQVATQTTREKRRFDYHRRRALVVFISAHHRNVWSLFSPPATLSLKYSRHV